MSSQVIETGNDMQIWSKEKREVLRKTFAPNLTNPEFAMFVGLGKSLGANPFNREIWAVKYGNSAAQIFLGRDFYRRKAQEQPNYKGHQVDAVYSGDKFKMIKGEPHHEYDLTDRGTLQGAYCVVYVEDRQPFFNFVDLSEYNTKQSNWKTKPETMIKKVAEAQALRAAFQGVFEGTYDESEQWKKEDKPVLEGADLANAKKALDSGDISMEKLNELWTIDEDAEEVLHDA